MIITETCIPGVFIIETDIYEDKRGIFIKTFNYTIFKEKGLEYDFKESFYSISKRGVVRGMHFQMPPYDYAKLVYATSGRIIDVVLDIRKGLPTYGKYISVELSAENGKCIYISRGCAHGFLALEDNSTVIYLQTKEYSPEHDKGVRWDSFGMNWEIEKPILSSRDSGFPKIDEIESHFNL